MPSWPWNSAACPVTSLRRPEEELEQVEVVDRVFEQRAGPDLVAVGAPGRVVHALDRDELVVAEHHAHHAPALGLIDQTLEKQEGGRIAQHQADLIHHARGLYRIDHAARVVEVGGERLLAEHGLAHERSPPRPPEDGPRSRCRRTPRRRRRGARPRSPSPAPRSPPRRPRPSGRPGRTRRRSMHRRRRCAASCRGRRR